MTSVHYLADHSSCSWVSTSQGLVPGEAEAGADLVVVVDYAQETHVPTTFPLVRGSDATQLRRRRLDNEFPNIKLRTVLPVKQRPADGLSDVVMIAAGTDAAGEQQLLALAERHALRSICTPALLIAEWLARAKLRSRLLVMLPTPAGLRMTFIDQGVPLLSRLTMPIAQGGTATELARTVQYLQNTQRIERGEQLEIWFWGMTEAEIAMSQPTGVGFHAGTTPAVPGLPDPERDGLTALLEMAAQRSPGALLAPDGMRLNWFAREMSRHTLYAAGCIVLAGVAMLGAMQWRALGLLKDAAAIQAQTATVAADQSGVEEMLSQRGLQLEDVRLIPDLEQALNKTTTSLDEAFRVTGHAFGARPEILVQSLEFFSAPLASLQAAERSCGNEPIPQGATIEVRFSLDSGLGVRQRSEAIAHARSAMAEPGPWQPTPASATLGTHDALTLKAGMDTGPDDIEWLACLLRPGVS